ncbi:insulinase family protein [Massilia sp. B-10]|nr:insulinase family protein [Massilia sp. B-10]UUZ57351.1 insulinase family protein [Massilia sp. H-1]
MRMRHVPVLLAGLSLSLSAFAATTDSWKIPVSVKKLDNGLTVIVSPDHSSPTVGVSVVYHVGMRLEPKNRTGFAHLFEHLMFQGTPNAPKGVFDKAITGGGGRNNGSTRPDFTNYIETAPVSAPRLDPVARSGPHEDPGLQRELAQEPAGRGQGRDSREREEPALRRLHVDRHLAAGVPEMGKQP